MEEGKMKCSCPHHKFVPGLIALFGLVFLLGTLGKLSNNTVQMVWPILVIAAGLMKMFEYKCKCD